MTVKNSLTVAPAVKWIHTTHRWIIFDNFKQPDWGCCWVFFSMLCSNYQCGTYNYLEFRSVDMSNAWYRRLAFTRTDTWCWLFCRRMTRWSRCGRKIKTFMSCGFNYSQTMFFLILFSIKSITAHHQRAKLVSYIETAHEGLKRFAV